MGIEGSCPWGGCVKAIVSVGGGTLNQKVVDNCRTPPPYSDESAMILKRRSREFYPILLIFFSFSSSMLLIFLPSIVINLSVAKLESVRMAFEVVIFDKLAKSSRER